MSERAKRRTRILSVVAATIISLACGTNVCYHMTAIDSELCVDAGRL